MNMKSFLGAQAALVAGILLVGAAADEVDDARAVERGRYLVAISGCNDCHTPNYMQNDGKVPEAEWLTGVPIGFRGPWGVTYPTNLRILANSLSEEQWIVRARTPMRPPMPWFNLAQMTDEDLRAVYRYIRSAGPAGQYAPGYLPPGAPVETPVFDFVPHLPGATASQ